jgi:hypothetical protein
MATRIGGELSGSVTLSSAIRNRELADSWRHIANLPNVAYRRLSEVIDSAEDENEGKYDGEHIPNIY